MAVEVISHAYSRHVLHFGCLLIKAKSPNDFDLQLLLF